MRKRRSIFLDSLAALAISWGTAYYYKQEAPEVMLPLSIILGLLCLVILVPVSLRHLTPGRPLKRGASFAVGVSPLLALLSYPGLFLDPLSPLWLKFSLGNNYTWIAKGLLNFLLFFLVGYIFSRKVPAEKVTWKKAFLTLFVLMLIYAGIFFGGIVLYKYYPYL